MTGIQRVRQAIRNAPGGPFARGELVLESQFARDFMIWHAGGNPPAMRDDMDLQMACCRILGLDLICLQSPPSNGHSLPLKRIHRIADEGLFVFWIVDGVFQRAARHQGLMALLAEIARNPKRVQAKFKHLSGRVLSAMDQGVAAGAHGLIVADDIAYNQGTFTSPDFIEQNLLPFWKMQVRQAADGDVPLFFHSDGNLNMVLPLITAAGFDGLHGIESAAGMSLRVLKARYGRSLCLMGGLDPARLSIEGDPPDSGEEASAVLRREISSLITSTAGEGGFVFGTSSGLHAGMSPERVDLAYRLSFELEAELLADHKG